MVKQGIAGSRAASLLPVAGGLGYGALDWSRASAAGAHLNFGSLSANVPTWVTAPRLSGIQLSNWSNGTAPLPAGQLGYSSSLGKLDLSAPEARAGAIELGSSAGSGSLRYGLTPALTLESRVEAAPSMTTFGLGGLYSAGDWGTLHAAAAQSRYQALGGWRYAVSYDVDMDYVRIKYLNQQTSAGFGSLAAYADGAGSEHVSNNTVTAGVPLGALGVFSGTYSGTQEDGVLVSKRVGVLHSVQLAPSLEMALGADRDVETGAYKMLMNLSMPVELFMGGLGMRWLGR